MHEVNFVLVENEEIVTGNTKIDVLCKYKNKRNDTAYNLILYSVGEVLITDSLYEHFMDTAISGFVLHFRIYSYMKDVDEIQHDYDFEVGRTWLTGPYFVLKIYDLKIDKYRRQFNSNGSKAAFDYNYGYGSFLAGRKFMNSKK